MCVTECHVVLGEKQIENVKEETEKKKTARIQMRMCAGNV